MVLNDTLGGDSEFYYNLERYERTGLEVFLEHVKEYFADRRSIPVSKTNSINKNPEVAFIFSDKLLEGFLDRDRMLAKSYEVAIKYGLLGHSQGGRNGIFYQKKEDKRMVGDTNRLINEHKENIIDYLKINENEISCLKKVKIVCHNPVGERIVGVYNEKNKRIIFLDFAHY